MSAEKFSASMDDELLEQARSAAEADGVTFSSWLADAAAHRLRLRDLRNTVDNWEAKHGAITAEELDAVERKIAKARGIKSRRTPRAKAS